MNGGALKKLGLLACLSKIIAGTMYYYSLEFLGQTCVDAGYPASVKGCPNGQGYFKRTAFFALLLFSSMSLILIPFFLFRYNKPGVTKIDSRAFLNMLVPSFMEFIGQNMSMYAITYPIPMSLILTLKGAKVPFAAILVMLFLKRKLFSFHWVAVGLTMGGLCVSTIPSLVEGNSSSGEIGQVLIGISVVLAAEFIRTAKSVLEEKLLKKLRYDALFVVGLQGLYCTIFTIPALFVWSTIKGNDRGVMEDLSTTLYMYAHSPIVIGISLTFPLSVCGLFMSGAYVTKLMSAVHNAMTSIVTTSLVWMVATIVHYINTTRGKPLTKLSVLQLIGLAIIVFASLLYDADIKFPKVFNYPADLAAAAGIGDSTKDSFLRDGEKLSTVASSLEDGEGDKLHEENTSAVIATKA